MASELELFGYAPGSYMNNCTSCGQTFMGDKRAWNCEPCAKALSLQANTRPAPATTDTGLETVGYHIVGSRTAITKDKDVTARWMLGNPNSKIEDVVPRSQAVELLAAERAEKEEARQAWKEAVAMYEQEKARVDPALKQIFSLETDNAAKDARIKELEAVNEVREAANITLYDAATKNGDRVEALETILAVSEKRIKHWIASCAASDEKVEALEAKLAAAEKALEPFADHANDQAVDDTGWRDKETVKIVVSIGDLRKARAVLGGKPSC